MNTITLKLKRIDPVKYATIAGFLTALFLFIILIPAVLLFSVVGISASDLGMGLGFLGGGIFMLLLVPVFYGITIFITTLISTALLNFVLKKTGGLDLDFEKAGLEVASIGKTE